MCVHTFISISCSPLLLTLRLSVVVRLAVNKIIGYYIPDADIGASSQLLQDRHFKQFAKMYA